MKLRATILAEHSKANCLRIVNWVGDSQSRFDELFKLFCNDEYRVVQRAGWPLSNIIIAHPGLIQKHFSKLLKNLDRPGTHEAVKRNTARLLQYVKIPKRFQGQIMDRCFAYIASPTEAIAVKAFSLTILRNLAHEYPEIRQELISIIEDRIDHETAAFRSRAKKIIKEFTSFTAFRMTI